MGLTTETFDIITRIAIGNGALIYRAVEKSTLRQVALKLLSQEGELDHRMDLDALFAAAPQLKQITGAHICQLLAAHTDDDGPVLVYEFANGISGADFPQQRKLDATQALDVAAQLISSLRSGERQRVPHGDLKPSQIIFVDMPDGRPFTFVLDWGLATFRDDIRDDSLPFTSPERLAGAPPSHSADLFSAGAVLFYLYTGKILAGGADPDAAAAAWRNAKPGVLAELRPDLSPKLVQWLTSLLALDPALRPASAVEAGTALAALGPPPPQVPPESIRPRPAPKPVAAPPASAIARPAVSGVRPAPAAPTPRTQPAKIAAPPPKKSSTILTIGLLLVCLAGLTVGAVMMMRMRKGGDSEPAAATDRPTRTPAPSVARTEPREPAPAPAPPAASAAPAAVAVAAPPAPKPVEPASPPPPKAAKAAKADPIFVATEPFAYAAGSALDGLGDGTGWGDSWRGPAATIEASSLKYPGYRETGGSLVIADTAQETIWTRNVGPLSRFVKDPAKGGHWYLSFFIQHTDDSPAQAGDIMFNPFDTSDPHKLIRIVVTDAGTTLRIAHNDPKAFVEVPDASKPVFVVSRIEFTNPQFDWWDIKVSTIINPNLRTKSFPGGAKPIVTELKRQTVPKQFGLMIRKLRSEATTRIDEIRLSKHWEETVFQPPQKDPPGK